MAGLAEPRIEQPQVPSSWERFEALYRACRDDVFAYAATLLRGEPQPHDHAALRWVSAAELDDVDWVPADRDFLPALATLLS